MVKRWCEGQQAEREVEAGGWGRRAEEGRGDDLSVGDGEILSRDGGDRYRKRNGDACVLLGIGRRVESDDVRTDVGESVEDRECEREERSVGNVIDDTRGGGQRKL